jgi:uncharacterized protein YbjT (DUF2867 family)
MRVKMLEKKSVIITGATGMVGGYALDYCLRSEYVGTVTALVRNHIGRKHPKLVEVIIKDFEDYSAVSDHLSGHDTALFCIGVYTGAVPNDEFERITVDYTKAFVSALLERSGPVSFCFLSGAGADRKERSKMVFARSKGKAENHLLRQDFGSLHIFRPGYIYPVKKRNEPNLGYRISRTIWPVMKRISPGMGINSDDLGNAIADIGIKGVGLETYENKDILKHLKVMKDINGNG